MPRPMRKGQSKLKQLRRASAIAGLVLLSATALAPPHGQAQTTPSLPSVPATMATDVPQRMADGSLFVPKATQHLLSVRTVLTAETKAPRTVELTGTVIADPNSFGRVQAAMPAASTRLRAAWRSSASASGRANCSRTCSTTSRLTTRATCKARSLSSRRVSRSRKRNWPGISRRRWRFLRSKSTRRRVRFRLCARSARSSCRRWPSVRRYARRSAASYRQPMSWPASRSMPAR